MNSAKIPKNKNGRAVKTQSAGNPIKRAYHIFTQTLGYKSSYNKPAKCAYKTYTYQHCNCCLRCKNIEHRGVWLFCPVINSYVENIRVCDHYR